MYTFCLSEGAALLRSPMTGLMPGRNVEAQGSALRPMASWVWAPRVLSDIGLL